MDIIVYWTAPLGGNEPYWNCDYDNSFVHGQCLSLKGDNFYHYV